MRLFSLILFFISCPIYADNWVCPAESIAIYGGEFCEAEHADFKADQADIRLNKVYKQLLQEPSIAEHRQLWVNTQRAWLKFSQAQCEALLSKFPSSPATKRQLAGSCREQKIIERTQELEGYCDSCNSSNPSFKRDTLKRAP